VCRLSSLNASSHKESGKPVSSKLYAIDEVIVAIDDEIIDVITYLYYHCMIVT
jgi:hypothetical protein